MELRINFPSLPEGKTLMDVRTDLDAILEEDGWLLTSQETNGAGFLELELEEERQNPKYGILAVKNYLQKAGFCKETSIELAGTPVGIFE